MTKHEDQELEAQQEAAREAQQNDVGGLGANGEGDVLAENEVGASDRLDDRVVSRRIEEQVVDGRRLGRHVLHNPLSRRFPAERATAVVSVAHKSVGMPLNQLSTGKCTCEALGGAGNSVPDYKGGHVWVDSDTDRWYEVETSMEGSPWLPSNPTVNDIGGSGLMVCRAAKSLGLLSSYHHAFGIEHALLATVLRPTIWGVDWYEGFDSPDHNGLVKIAGQVRGGHEIAALEIDVANRLLWFVQSWGLGWGVARASIGLPKGGAFCMGFDTADQLLQAQGDCTVPYFR